MCIKRNYDLKIRNHKTSCLLCRCFFKNKIFDKQSIELENKPEFSLLKNF